MKLFLLLFLLLQAQGAPDLTVTLRDQHGAPVANVLVVARDPAGAQDLARATTDASGRAAFAGLPLSELRVALVGALPDGTPLVLRGHDAPGILVFLDAGATRLDLLVEPDGAVLPDPATMVAPDAASSAELFPTAPLARPPATAAPTAGPAPGQQTAVLAAAPAQAAAPLAGYALVAALLAGVAAALVWGRRA